MHVKNF